MAAVIQLSCKLGPSAIQNIKCNHEPHQNPNEKKRKKERGTAGGFEGSEKREIMPEQVPITTARATPPAGSNRGGGRLLPTTSVEWAPLNAGRPAWPRRCPGTRRCAPRRRSASAGRDLQDDAGFFSFFFCLNHHHRVSDNTALCRGRWRLTCLQLFPASDVMNMPALAEDSSVPVLPAECKIVNHPRVGGWGKRHETQL